MIYINNIPSFRDPESYKVIPDDRIQKIELINSVAIQDYGHVKDGDAVAVTCLFSQANFNRLTALWEARASVTFKDISGVLWQDMIIVMKEYEPDKKFPKYILASMELWRRPKWLIRISTFT